MTIEQVGPMSTNPADAVEPGVSEQVFEMVTAGGPVVAVLAAMSVVALAIILVKLWQFAMSRVGDRTTARRALALHRAGRSIEAIDAAARSRNPVAQVVACAVRGTLYRDLPEAMVREEVARLATDRIEDLRMYFRPLEVIASVAPLLGLFGTVLGMIEAFRQLEQAGSQVDPSILSGGIWEALLTTAVGLAVAIPVVGILAWLERIVDRLTHEMENVVTQVFTRDLTIEPVLTEHAVEPRHDVARLRPAALVADR
ncbi:MotA/TolQ/ExbB proton channel [alpha proteobacterium BAL199]|jgi:biopolymer transport protein ExbB|nr:MotA/TolQ/ExbB proton channel [alpha proteobacterium BAL199]